MADNRTTDVRITIEFNHEEWEYEVCINGATVYGYEYDYFNACHAIHDVLESEHVLR